MSLRRCLSLPLPQGGDRSQHRQHDGHPERVADQSAEQLPLRGVEAWRRNQVGRGGERERESVCIQLFYTAVDQLVSTFLSRSSSDPSQMRRDRSTGTTSATSMSWSSDRQRWTPPGRSGPTTCWCGFQPYFPTLPLTLSFQPPTTSCFRNKKLQFKTHVVYNLLLCILLLNLLFSDADGSSLRLWTSLI